MPVEATGGGSRSGGRPPFNGSGIVFQKRPVAGVGGFPLIEVVLEVLAGAFERRLRLQRDRFGVGADGVVVEPLHIFELAHDAAAHDLAADLDLLAEERDDRDLHARPVFRAVEDLGCRHDEAFDPVAVALLDGRRRRRWHRRASVPCRGRAAAACGSGMTLPPQIAEHDVAAARNGRTASRRDRPLTRVQPSGARNIEQLPQRSLACRPRDSRLRPG